MADLKKTQERMKAAAGKLGVSGLRHGVPEGVKRVVAVYSGKGGVGKTFVTVGIARALAASGKKVGIVDADIDCPNVMKMMEISGKIVANEDKKMVPVVDDENGVTVISMAPILKGDEDSLMWRGPRTSRAVEQLIHDTAWGELDVLLVDMPPGTSDVPISVLQILEGAEVILVTTPSDLALMDAKRAATVVLKLGARLIGIVENMSGDVFGSGGGEELAKELDVPFLHRIPLGDSSSSNDPIDFSF